jgi:hypothetical protein
MQVWGMEQTQKPGKVLTLYNFNFSSIFPYKFLKKTLNMKYSLHLFETRDDTKTKPSK